MSICEVNIWNNHAEKYAFNKMELHLKQLDSRYLLDLRITAVITRTKFTIQVHEVHAVNSHRELTDPTEPEVLHESIQQYMQQSTDMIQEHLARPNR